MVRYNFVDIQTGELVRLSNWDKCDARTKVVHIQRERGAMTSIVIYLWKTAKLVTAADYHFYFGEPRETMNA